MKMPKSLLESFLFRAIVQRNGSMSTAGTLMNTFFKNLIQTDTRRQKRIFLILTVLAGIIILWPTLNFQNYISTGDHGRDLYSFRVTMEGGLPYRDYSWLYGPLMPFYYSLFMLLGGVTIQSVIFGQALLILAAGVLIYRICSVFLSPAVAWICALWYWSFRGVEFFYTYNHIGGLVAMLVALYCLVSYTDQRNRATVITGFLALFFLALIRLNMAIFFLGGYVLLLLIIDRVRYRGQTPSHLSLYLYGTLAVITTTVAVYWYLLHPLPDYAIMQSFPYGKFQRTDTTTGLLGSLKLGGEVVMSYFTATIAQMILGGLLVLSALQSGLVLTSGKTDGDYRKRGVLTFAAILMCMIAASHEFLASGTLFRFFWVLPFAYLLGFHCIAVATKSIRSKPIQSLILAVLILPALINVHHDHQLIRRYKKLNNALAVGPNKVYTTQNPKWLYTVMAASKYISDNVPHEDKILVIPFDALYLFLTGHQSVTRQLVFFEHINIPREQELDIIDRMEKDRGNWVLISNRSVVPGRGMGIFGRTYCPVLSRYIGENFEEAAEFGDMSVSGGWGWNHGVRILKRK